jgi:hypothetical protein
MFFYKGFFNFRILNPFSFPGRTFQLLHTKSSFHQRDFVDGERRSGAWLIRIPSSFFLTSETTGKSFSILCMLTFYYYMKNTCCIIHWQTFLIQIMNISNSKFDLFVLMTYDSFPHIAHIPNFTEQTQQDPKNGKKDDEIATSTGFQLWTNKQTNEKQRIVNWTKLIISSILNYPVNASC